MGRVAGTDGTLCYGRRTRVRCWSQRAAEAICQRTLGGDSGWGLW